jgi:tryptophan synthase beta subunit
MITKSEPDEHGHWGKFGGRYVPELVAPLERQELPRRTSFLPSLNNSCAITVVGQHRCFTRSD